MKDYLIHKLIPDYNNIKDEKVRLAYGKLSSYVGMVCNVLLFIVKMMVAIATNSLSILSDAINNLTDFINNIVTMVAYHLSAKPADKEHPYGHGRLEYIIAFIIEGIMIVVTGELLISALKRIVSPDELHYHPLYIGILVVTVCVKLWMFYFNQSIGKKADHLAIQAVAVDSRNDAIMTSVTILSLVFSHYFASIPIDSILSIIISCIILYSVFGMMKEVVDKLIGNPVSSSVQEEIKEEIRKNANILGVHDLLLHDYGPTKRMGSLHVEMPSSLSLEEAHAIIDQIEKQVYINHGIQLTIHIDPVNESKEVEQVKGQLKSILSSISSKLSFHDLHVHDDICQFDLTIPEDCSFTNEELYKRIANEMKPYHCDITFDHEYLSERIS